MRTDQHGNAVSATEPEALEAYDRAVDELLHLRPAVVDEVERALTVDPGFALGRALEAYLGMLGTEQVDAAAAAATLGQYRAGLDESTLNQRERVHLAAAAALVAGDLDGGGQLLSDLTDAYPRDALALAVGHQVDFFTGDATTLRDRVGAALGAWSPADPHRSLLLGMYAFGLEETGLYGRSEDVGRESVESDGTDVWGIHAVAHTYEMQGRFGDGLAYLDAHGPGWQRGTFLSVHNWWHYCLYLLEAGDPAAALEIYDASLHHAGSSCVAMEMLDAAALLWRLLLEGDDQTERWRVLAQAWDPKMAEPYYAFNDMHAVMAYVGAGRMADAEHLVASRTAWLAGHPDHPDHPDHASLTSPGLAVTNLRMTRTVGLPVARAMVAFGQGRYDAVVEELLPIRYEVNRFGGSHAQRDVVQRTLVEAAIRSGRHGLARGLLSERLGINPYSPYSWLKQAALADRMGDAAAAAAARTRAGTLRAHVAAASPLSG